MDDRTGTENWSSTDISVRPWTPEHRTPGHPDINTFAGRAAVAVAHMGKVMSCLGCSRLTYFAHTIVERWV